MKKISISRKNSLDLFRNYKIKLNNSEEKLLPNNKTISFQSDLNTDTAVIKLDWIEQTVKFDKNEDINVSIDNNPIFKYSLLSLIILSVLNTIFSNNIIKILMILCITIIISFYTFLRKKYFRIQVK